MKLGKLEVHLHPLPKKMDKLCQSGKFRIAILPDQTIGSLYRLLCVVPEKSDLEMFGTNGKEAVIIVTSEKFEGLPKSTPIKKSMIKIAPKSVFNEL